jgi:hypothetical protein
MPYIISTFIHCHCIDIKSICLLLGACQNFSYDWGPYFLVNKMSSNRRKEHALIHYTLSSFTAGCAVFQKARKYVCVWMCTYNCACARAAGRLRPLASCVEAGRFSRNFFCESYLYAIHESILSPKLLVIWYYLLFKYGNGLMCKPWKCAYAAAKPMCMWRLVLLINGLG